MAIVKAWSYSTYSLWKRCPGAYWLMKVDKLPVPPSPAMERGKAIHAKGEQYLKHSIPNVPKEFKPFSTELRNLRKHNAIAEQKNAVNKAWDTTEYFASDVWLRWVTDATAELSKTEVLVVDFKTGRKYDDHSEQAMLYAAAELSTNQHLKTIDVEFWYVDQDDIYTETFNAKLVSEYQAYWINEVRPMFEEEAFNYTPSRDTCRWCSFKDSCEAAIK